MLASILKPVDDIRMFHKLGRSLKLLADARLVVAGAGTNNPQETAGIKSYVLGRFTRLSFSRLAARAHVFMLAIRERPRIFVACTHELLATAVALRFLFGTRIVYDIQENYYLNIRHTDAFPTGLRAPLALAVRMKERLLIPFFHHVILAEQCYEEEMPFISRKKIVIAENKSLNGLRGFREPKDFRQKFTIELLFTGTMSESTGVFTAIELARQLHLVDPRVRLRLVGYCSLRRDWQRIEELAGNCDFISVVGGDNPVPHEVIEGYIQASDAGIIAYTDSIATRERMPTKLYEYLAFQLPILLSGNPKWKAKCDESSAAVLFSPTLDASHILLALQKNQFYKTEPRHVLWSDTVRGLQKVVL